MADGECGLGEDPRVEGGVVGGDELDLDQVLTGGEARQSLVEAMSDNAQELLMRLRVDLGGWLALLTHDSGTLVA